MDPRPLRERRVQTLLKVRFVTLPDGGGAGEPAPVSICARLRAFLHRVYGRLAAARP
jgi:hypothetical protein